MEENKRPFNIYRARHVESEEIHYFVGEYDYERQVYTAPVSDREYKHVLGEDKDAPKEFATFAEAMQYKGYSNYTIAARSAFIKYGGPINNGYSQCIPSGWDKNLGEGYEPWTSSRRIRKRQKA